MEIIEFIGQSRRINDGQPLFSGDATSFRRFSVPLSFIGMVACGSNDETDSYWRVMFCSDKLNNIYAILDDREGKKVLDAWEKYHNDSTKDICEENEIKSEPVSSIGELEI